MTKMQEIVNYIRQEAEVARLKGHVGYSFGKWRMLWDSIASDKDDPRVVCLEKWKKYMGDGAFFSFCEENTIDIQRDHGLTGAERKEAVIQRLYELKKDE